MASIAHVVSRKTIEFHRLHSHRQIVFWRFSTKNFSNFTENDLLFFLCKTNRKEKGLIGFGQLKQIKNYKTKYLYNRFGEKLGYNSNDEFINSVVSINKSQEVPDQLNCLTLDNVTYFKSPIYLSEFGFELNKQVESFIYLDTQVNITSMILDKVKKVGLDIWSESEDPFNHQLTGLSTLYQVALLVKESGLFNHSNRGIVHNQEKLMMNPEIGYKLNQDKVILSIPIYTQNKKEHYSVLGLIHQIKNEIKQDLQIELVSKIDLSQSLLARFSKERTNLEGPPTYTML